MILSLVGLGRPEPEIDGNQERPLPQRWRDPAPKPSRLSLFGARGD